MELLTELLTKGDDKILLYIDFDVRKKKKKTLGGKLQIIGLPSKTYCCLVQKTMPKSNFIWTPPVARQKEAHILDERVCL